MNKETEQLENSSKSDGFYNPINYKERALAKSVGFEYLMSFISNNKTCLKLRPDTRVYYILDLNLKLKDYFDSESQPIINEILNSNKEATFFYEGSFIENTSADGVFVGWEDEGSKYQIIDPKWIDLEKRVDLQKRILDNLNSFEKLIKDSLKPK